MYIFPSKHPHKLLLPRKQPKQHIVFIIVAPVVDI